MIGSRLLPVLSSTTDFKTSQPQQQLAISILEVLQKYIYIYTASTFSANRKRW